MAVMHLLRVEVVGKVQGVGFRAFVKEQARVLGIAGWVRNNSNGSVEVAAKLAKHKTEIFIRALRRGPALARVWRLDVLPTVGLTIDFANFRILR